MLQELNDAQNIVITTTIILFDDGQPMQEIVDRSELEGTLSLMFLPLTTRRGVSVSTHHSSTLPHIYSSLKITWREEHPPLGTFQTRVPGRGAQGIHMHASA